MGCASNVVKCVLVVANVVFALAGVALTGVGAAALVSLREDGIADRFSEHLSIAAMAVGAVAFVVAFFGCCGAIIENKSMLVTYSVLLIVLMNVKSALATVLLTASKAIADAMVHSFQKLFDQQSSAFTDFERSVGCCGTVGAESYMPRPIPASCCYDGPCTRTNSHQGCLPEVSNLVETYSLSVAVLCLILVGIELIAVILGLCLANHADKKYKGRYYQ